MTGDIASILAPSGTLRAAINLGNTVLAQQDAPDAEPRGVSVAIAREIARRLGVPVAFSTFGSAGGAFEALSTLEADIAFMAIDPARSTEVEFSPPYVLIEGTYLVPAASAARSVAEIDRDGARIAAVRNSAYDLYLSRSLRHARLVYAPSLNAGIEMMSRERLDAVSGVRQIFIGAVGSNPRYRILDDSFLEIGQAVGIPKARAECIGFVAGIVEQLKASGAVARLLLEHGQSARVAPPSKAR